MTLQASQSPDFTATVTGTDGYGGDLDDDATVGTLTPNGQTANYTAPGTISSEQTVTITATSVADTTEAAATVTLMPPAGGLSSPPAYAGGGRYVERRGQ